jgi:hypothetical protein
VLNKGILIDNVSVSLAAEKEDALSLAEKERLMREQESLAAKKKEEQINGTHAPLPRSTYLEQAELMNLLMCRAENFRANVSWRTGPRVKTAAG